MKVKVIHSSQDDGGLGCAGGSCPTIYETDRGTILLQGCVLTAEDKRSLCIPQNEDVVEVPKEFIERFVAKGN